MTADVLYKWPPAARFGRVVPKTKFYEHGKISTSVRERFVVEVQRITWAYKLADSTIHLRGTEAVPEIQIFTIDAKGDDVSEDVLSAIDRAVLFPIIFEVVSGERVRTVAAQKSLSSKMPAVGTYFATDWQPANAPRLPLPTALDLPKLYEALLSTLLPTGTRVGETVSDATKRLDRARKLQREVAALKKRLRTEPQLNRKIELRRQINERSSVLAGLTDSVPSEMD